MPAPGSSAKGLSPALFCELDDVPKDPALSPASSWGLGGKEQPRGSRLESLQGVPWVRQPTLLTQLLMVLPSWWDTKDCPFWAQRERFQRTLINEIGRTPSKPQGYNDK